jgi:hypothetical protein
VAALSPTKEMLPRHAQTSVGKIHVRIVRHCVHLEKSDCTATVVRQRPANNNREIVFSARSAKKQLNSKRGTVFSVLSYRDVIRRTIAAMSLLRESRQHVRT